MIFAIPGLFSAVRQFVGRYYGGYILAFHNLPPTLFERQIDALAPDRPISLSELVDRQIHGESTSGLFAITVDDGVRTTVREISEVCIRRGWPVTFFLPTGYLDKTNPMAFQLKNIIIQYLPQRIITLFGVDYNLKTKTGKRNFILALNNALYRKSKNIYMPILSALVDEIIEDGLAKKENLQPPEPVMWDEVKELSSDPNISFESHGVTHTALSTLSAEHIQSEIINSQNRIAAITNQPCNHFCYPCGGDESIGESAPVIVGKRYRSAVTMTRGRLNNKDLLRLPRIPIHDIDSPCRARLKILTW